MFIKYAMNEFLPSAEEGEVDFSLILISVVTASSQHAPSQMHTPIAHLVA